MQRAKPREVEIGVQLWELTDRPIPRLVGRFASESEVANLGRMEALFEIGINDP